MHRRGNLWQRGLAGSLVFLLIVTVWALAATSASSQGEGDGPALEGKAIFGQKCATCHAIGRQLVGPDLKGVIARREEAWLKTQILSPSVLKAKNDPTAKANLEKFGMSMPDLGLTEQQTEAVIAYLKTAETAPAAARPAQLVPTLAIGLLVIVGLTLTGLIVGNKRVEVRP
ncbi:MAG: cytochrome c [Chloroflexi bacterium]|nr:cytochrome c [Chloroflexota bacterium]